MDWVLVIVASGWVFAGRLLDHNEQCVVLEDAAVVRYWGTDRGIGQLRAGPRPETRCDPVGEPVLIRSNVLAVIRVTSAGAPRWTEWAAQDYAPRGGSRVNR